MRRGLRCCSRGVLFERAHSTTKGLGSTLRCLMKSQGMSGVRKQETWVMRKNLETRTMGKQKRILVTGAGGFIGHHLVKRLKSDGHWVRGVDIKYPEYEPTASDAFEILDLRRAENCLLATRGGIDEIYNLAADMGA
jgi:NAD dependent epimerase/dehydratase family